MTSKVQGMDYNRIHCNRLHSILFNLSYNTHYNIQYRV